MKSMLRRLGSFFAEILEIIVFAISIFLFVYLLVTQPHKIKGASMEPNFHDGEYLLTDKITYRFNDPKRGDIIVFKAPPDFKEEYIKRIIGLPNDKLSLKNGDVYLNGSRLNETYLTDGVYTTAGKYLTEVNEYLVPENAYFVMGDNREHSYDSRMLGPIPRDKFTGRAWFVYWPPAQVGTIQAQVY